jgi:hypothetical protein
MLRRNDETGGSRDLRTRDLDIGFGRLRGWSDAAECGMGRPSENKNP